MLNVIIAGLGGQGTILASRLIGEAAVAAGLDVRGSETIGMAQRGGSVISHLRIGEHIFSPLIPPRGADIIIAFEAGEAVRAADFLKADGIVVVCDRIIKPVSGGETYEKQTMLAWLCANIKKLFVADGEKIAAQCGDRCLNTALVGCAMQIGVFPFSPGDMETIIKKKVKSQYVEQNINALHVGQALYTGQALQTGVESNISP
ncbi:MAG: indolepyruvate oxidoreductase subunit beta [Treponema sp.]|jgi:indolepyruvate ferredoxin oxidoreductase beta subunit|nr:indolepyruvate oxidoreductase subunit beta [Treponema sp.]